MTRPLSRRAALSAALGTALAAAAARPAPAVPDPGFERALLAEINRVRAQHRARAVRIDPRLSAAAAVHARDLARRRVIDHAGADGRFAQDRVEREGYLWGFVAENVASGSADAAQTVALWMDSPGHRRNLLSPDALDIGAAREVVPDDIQRTYDVLVLAHPRDRRR